MNKLVRPALGDYSTASDPPAGLRERYKQERAENGNEKVEGRTGEKGRRGKITEMVG